MTFLELQQAVYADCGYSAAPAAEVQTRVKRWLNQAQRTLLRMPVLSGQRDGTLELTTINGQPVYGLPQAFARITTIVQRSNNRPLYYRTRSWFRATDPAESATGNPDIWIPEGRQPVMRHPNGTAVWVQSGSPTDTTQKVFFTGVRANGDRQIQYSATLTGTTRMQITGLTDWKRVLGWSLDTDNVGDVQLFDGPGLNALELGRIPAHTSHVHYQGIRFWPTPTDALTYTIDGQFSIVDMRLDTDIPMISDDWHDMLQLWARRCEYERTGDRRMGIVNKDWDDVMAGLKSESEFPADYRAVAGKFSGRVGVNNLGAMYPADYFR